LFFVLFVYFVVASALIGTSARVGGGLRLQR